MYHNTPGHFSYDFCESRTVCVSQKFGPEVAPRLRPYLGLLRGYSGRPSGLDSSSSASDSGSRLPVLGLTSERFPFCSLLFPQFFDKRQTKNLNS